MKLCLPEAARAAISAHAERTYPEECCGALLGREADGPEPRQVVRILEVENTKDENRARRYLIEPKALLAAERAARQEGLDVVGIYHSHPDHPSRPSEFDREHAMPVWSYVIVVCHKGKVVGLQSWQLKEDRSAFDEEQVLP